VVVALHDNALGELVVLAHTAFVRADASCPCLLRGSPTPASLPTTRLHMVLAPGKLTAFALPHGRPDAELQAAA
jgi:hypothetical protein